MKNKSTLFIGLLLFTSTIAIGQPGSLDGDFDADGKVTTDIGNEKNMAYSVAIQPDGKIIVAGSSGDGFERDFAIVRYNIDGTLDNSFSVDGIVTSDLGSDNDRVHSVVIQPDGKILVAGFRFGSSDQPDFALARYNTDGVLDNSFSVDGKVITDFAGEFDIANAVVMQSDGKIVAAGYSSPGFAVVRYNPDGTLDHSFGVAGKVNTAIIGNSSEGKSAVIQPDGKIIVAGFTSNGTALDFAVMRYNTDGSLDNSFSVDGIVTTDFGFDADWGSSVALQPDGKIVVAGKSGNRDATDSEFALVRYNTDGTLDNNFSVDGKVTTAIGNEKDYATSVAIQPDGKIIAAGYSENDDTGFNFAVVRYNMDGTLDTTFGVSGKVTTSFGTVAFGLGSAIQPNGRIVVAGYISFTNSDIAVARYISGLNVGVIDFTIQDHNLIIYPNPLQDNAVIEYTLAKDDIISIDLYDISGRLRQSIVKSEERVKGSHKESLNLDTSVPSGSYILTISNSEGSSSVQVVK